MRRTLSLWRADSSHGLRAHTPSVSLGATIGHDIVQGRNGGNFIDSDGAMRTMDSRNGRRALSLVTKAPVVGPMVHALARRPMIDKLVRQWKFGGSSSYWERRYVGGGNSGAGSYGRLARF